MEHVKPSQVSDSESVRTINAGKSETALQRLTGPRHAALALQRAAGNQAVGELLQVLTGPGQPLGSATRAVMGERFGTDFSDVRIHNDAQANASARALGAAAFTSGQHVVFGPGAFCPNERRGGALLAHELAHVIQQSRGGNPAVDASADTSLEAEAESAAKGFLQGVSQIPIHGSAAPGLACAPKVPEDKDEKKHTHPIVTPVIQPPRKAKPLARPVQHEITDPNKAKGVGAEATVPFDRYSGKDWNHIGGGGETASSRTNLARRSSHDIRIGQEGTAGIDYLVENVKTGRLVIGEQKATKGAEFSKTTAITTSLEDNVDHAVKVLQKQIDSGAVKEPTEVKRLQKTIDRLKATKIALEKGRAGLPAELPEGVVFELTNVGGAGKQIGKGHIDLLAKKYGKNPKFLEHLLRRTFVRDPALAKSMGAIRAACAAPTPTPTSCPPPTS